MGGRRLEEGGEKGEGKGKGGKGEGGGDLLQGLRGDRRPWILMV